MRPLDQEDIHAIRTALSVLQSDSKAPQMPMSNLGAAMWHISRQDSLGLAVMVGPYFLLTDVGVPWYMTDKVLFEDLVLKVYPDKADIAEVIRALHELRDRHGCKAIIAGDTQAGKMIPVYTSHGFKPMGQQLIKE